MKILICNTGRPLKVVIDNQNHQFKDGQNDLPEHIAKHILQYHSKHATLLFADIKDAELEIVKEIIIEPKPTEIIPAKEIIKEKGKPGRKPKK